MSEILFVTWDGGGNLPPARGIATELASRGHRVRFLGHPGQREAVAGAGLEFTAYRSARPFSSLSPGSPAEMIEMFGDRGMGRDLLAEHDDRPADLVVVDCLLFGALEAARDAGLRYAVLEHLYDEYLHGGWLRGPLGQGMTAKGLDPLRSLDAAALTLVTTLPRLDPGSRRPHAGRLAFVGPVVSASPGVPSEPMVLVSLSTYAFPGMTACLQTILDATADLEARVVTTTGPVIDPADLQLPGNAEAHRFVPHAQLMPYASLVVGHGGHGTTMQALAHDLPLVVMPLHPFLDQPMVGASVERAGAGRVVSRDATAAELGPVIAEILADGPHRAAAAGLGTAIRALPGATNGADRIEAWLSSQPAAEPGHLAARY